MDLDPNSGEIRTIQHNNTVKTVGSTGRIYGGNSI